MSEFISESHADSDTTNLEGPSSTFLYLTARSVIPERANNGKLGMGGIAGKMDIVTANSPAYLEDSNERQRD